MAWYIKYIKYGYIISFGLCGISHLDICVFGMCLLSTQAKLRAANTIWFSCLSIFCKIAYRKNFYVCGSKKGGNGWFLYGNYNAISSSCLEIGRVEGRGEGERGIVWLKFMSLIIYKMRIVSRLRILSRDHIQMYIEGCHLELHTTLYCAKNTSGGSKLFWISCIWVYGTGKYCKWNEEQKKWHWQK